MRSLKAAHLNQQAVVTGGYADGGPPSGGYRDEVLCGIFYLHISLEVLQYNPSTNAWLKIGQMQEARVSHAIVEANLGVLCTASGNLNQIKLSFSTS